MAIRLRRGFTVPLPQLADPALDLVGPVDLTLSRFGKDRERWVSGDARRICSTREAWAELCRALRTSGTPARQLCESTTPLPSLDEVAVAVQRCLVDFPGITVTLVVGHGEDPQEVARRVLVSAPAYNYLPWVWLTRVNPLTGVKEVVSAKFAMRGVETPKGDLKVPFAPTVALPNSSVFTVRQAARGRACRVPSAAPRVAPPIMVVYLPRDGPEVLRGVVGGVGSEVLVMTFDNQAGSALAVLG